MRLYVFKKRCVENAEKFAEHLQVGNEENCTKSEENEKSKLPLQCETCGKVLGCQNSLVQHVRLHSGQKPFCCDVCQKKFARAEHLNIHKRTHTGRECCC